MRSRFAATLLVFLGAAALLLVWEHRAHVFSANGILLGLLALCVVMHFFMHGHHHRHESDEGQEHPEDRDLR